jgi:hypothetical protein
MRSHFYRSPSGPAYQNILFQKCKTISNAAYTALQVFGQQRSWVQRLLNYEHEVFALVCLVLDSQSLRNLDATFAESLYGLKRHQHADSSQQRLGAGQLGAEQGNGRPTRRQQNLALLCQVRASEGLTSKLESSWGADVGDMLFELPFSTRESQNSPDCSAGAAATVVRTAVVDGLADMWESS